MIGEVFHVHGVYLQDWLSDAGVRNWRLDPAQSGASTTFADIGTHWCDLAMHLLDRRIESVCAVTGSRHGRPIDDHGGVLLRFQGGALGTLVASQVSPGAKNSLRIRLDGSDGSLYWDQERPEELWLGRAGGPTELRHKSAGQLHERAEPPGASARRRAGGVEHDVRQPVRVRLPDDPRSPGSRRRVGRHAAEGLLLMRLIDAVTRSNAERAWVSV